MARANIAIQDLVAAGITPAPTAADSVNGMEFLNDGNVILHFKNTNGASRTATIQTSALVGGLAVAEETVVVPATTGEKITKTFDPAIYGQAGGKVFIDLDASAGLTVAAYRIPRH